MYSTAVAEQLRARDHDVISRHDPDCRSLEGAPDDEVFVAAIATKRALVTENVAEKTRSSGKSKGSRHEPKGLFSG